LPRRIRVDATELGVARRHFRFDDRRKTLVTALDHCPIARGVFESRIDRDAHRGGDLSLACEVSRRIAGGDLSKTVPMSGARSMG